VSLIAEDLLLLLLDDDRGTLSMSYPQPTLGGALLVELALVGVVRVEKTSAWRSAKVVAEPGVEVDDPLLRAALATVAEKERSAQDLVNRLGKHLKDTLAERLVERGILQRVDDRVLGLFPRKRWPAVDSAHEEEVRRELAAVLVTGLTPTPRTGALIALLSAIDKAHKVVDRQGLPVREVRARAKEVAKGDWAAAAVKDAIAASTAAMAAVIAASTASAASGGS
jgi:hypothetical protein